jgi:peptide-methionine (S)-S-oxide reductase
MIKVGDCDGPHKETPMFAAWHAQRYWILAAFLIFAASVGCYAVAHLDRSPEKTTMAHEPRELPPNCELATLGGGCFWCLEAAFEQVKGVERVESGYAGGGVNNPTYEQVCTGRTGHAEVVQVAFDPKAISYREILEIFFVIHDPTTLNRQGGDVGTQYRSAIFYHSPAQKETAEKLIAELTAEKAYNLPIVTQVAPLDVFYRAEDYHQGYFRANPHKSYCQYVVAPKVEKLRHTFKSKLKTP